MLRRFRLRLGRWLLRGLEAPSRASRGQLLKDAATVLEGYNVRTVFDVGANQGDLTLRYLARFPLATVHCFEPSPRPLERLRARFGEHPRVRIHPVAVWAHAGKAPLHCHSSDPTDSLLAPRPSGGRWTDHEHDLDPVDLREVETVTLDGFCEAHRIRSIDLLKMDIQGAELRALRGATALLESAAIGAIWSELNNVPIYVDQAIFHEVCAYLTTFGYRLYNLYEFAYFPGDNQLRWMNGLFIPPERNE